MAMVQFREYDPNQLFKTRIFVPTNRACRRCVESDHFISECPRNQGHGGFRSSPVNSIQDGGDVAVIAKDVSSQTSSDTGTESASISNEVRVNKVPNSVQRCYVCSEPGHLR